MSNSKTIHILKSTINYVPARIRFYYVHINTVIFYRYHFLIKMCKVVM